MDYPDRITAIVTGLPPSVDGVGDYAWYLAQQIREDFSISTEFIVGNPGWEPTPEFNQINIQRIPKRSPSELLKLLQSSSIVLLHYVGYGYAKRGCPIWLVEGLGKWRRENDQKYLLTMFHEVYAYNPKIWSSQFWTSPLQRNLAQRLAQLSDHCLTSKQGYAERITQLSGGKHPNVLSLPVFSNVGEPKPEQLRPLSQRSKRLIIFGGRGTRSRVYQRSLFALERTCRELQIEEIFDIGPLLDFELPLINQTSVKSLGVKTTQEISQLLSNSIVGFFDYSIEFLAKSTIFAAYCAHRLLPVGVFYPGKDVDGLMVGKHYWIADIHPDPMSLISGQLVADNAYTWYQQHQLSVQAQVFVSYLEK
jgi:hypothetical protein